MIKVVAESSIPYLRGLLEPYAEIEYISNEELSQERIRQTDALIVRSITKCNAELLRHTSVKFIATATAGIDHVDEAYCHRAGIHYTNAAGCNAIAVAEYVFSCLSKLSLRDGEHLGGKTIGIIGVGHVGREVERIAHALGMRTLLYDPPRAEREGWEGFCTLERIQSESDIITLHVPLTDETKHLVDTHFLKACRRRPTLINACRGAVCSTQALIEGKECGQISRLILDCWEGEPHIDHKLLELTDLATPHIAGFSADGKHRGSRMAALAVSDFFGLGLSSEILQPDALQTPSTALSLSHYPRVEQVARAILMCLNLEATDTALRQNADSFEALRKQYVYPRETSAYRIADASPEVLPTLKQIGFIIA